MKILKVYQIYFSPTGSTERVVKGIGDAFSAYPVENIDLTRYEARQEEYSFKENELVIIGAPVYGGRLPAACPLFTEMVRSEMRYWNYRNV